MPRVEYAADVVVHQWYCTYGTRVVVVAAGSKDEACAMVMGRFGLGRHEVRARRLRASDVENLARIAEHAAQLA